MKTSITIVMFTGLWMTCVSAPGDVVEKRRVSPRGTVVEEIGGSRIEVSYGRPYTKDPFTGLPRRIWGGLVPWGRIWRTGADEATSISTENALAFNGIVLEAGQYSIYTLPIERGTSKIIFNRMVGQSGTVYLEHRDTARIDLIRAAARERAAQFTIYIDKVDKDSGQLRMTWEELEFTVPIRVPQTR